jgi:hypothetical protein
MPTRVMPQKDRSYTSNEHFGQATMLDLLAFNAMIAISEMIKTTTQIIVAFKSLGFLRKAFLLSLTYFKPKPRHGY